MKKIKLETIVKNINEFLDPYNEKEFSVKFNSRKSSDGFDNSDSLVIEVFASFLILIAIYHYKLKFVNQKLPEKTIKNLQKFIEERKKKFFEENPSQKEGKKMKHLLRKYDKWKGQKKFLIETNNIIFDDNGTTHFAAFTINSLSELPNKNILLKFTIESVHIRCGISIKENTFTIMNIVKKANKN